VNIVVTGGLGHIGSYLIRHLNQFLEVDRLIIIDNLQTQRLVSLFDLEGTPSIAFLEKEAGSVLVEEIFKYGKIDCVIHLAATTDASGTANQRDALFENNLGTTKSVIELCAKFKIPMIFPSSTSVYGSQSVLVDETCDELFPQSPYAESKLMEEQAIQNASTSGLEGVILRLGTIHGISPGMRFHTAVNKFCFQASTNSPLTVWKTAMNQYRPYLALEDACRAIAHVISKQLFGSEIYNVVTSNHTVLEILNAIEMKTGRLCTVDYVESQIMNQLSYEVSSDKFKGTGFDFRGSLQKDVGETMHLLAGISND
jgi:UDP-glucose 4-epimerase